jgi:hypothetical protein
MCYFYHVIYAQLLVHIVALKIKRLSQATEQSPNLSICSFFIQTHTQRERPVCMCYVYVYINIYVYITLEHLTYDAFTLTFRASCSTSKCIPVLALGNNLEAGHGSLINP